MNSSIRDKVGFWLERFTFLHGVLLRYDGIAPGGKRRYENRINGHVVVREPQDGAA